MNCRLTTKAKRLLVIGAWCDIVLNGGPYHPAFEESISALHGLVLESTEEDILRLFDLLVDSD